jgi:hypothetical protein
MKNLSVSAIQNKIDIEGIANVGTAPEWDIIKHNRMPEIAAKLKSFGYTVNIEVLMGITCYTITFGKITN